MRFLGRSSGKAGDVDNIHYPVRGQKPVRLDELGLKVTYEDMVAYPWIVGFDLDDKKQRARAAAIVDLTENWMVTFNVVKVGRTGRKGVGTDVRKTELTRFMDFPTARQVYDRVYEGWGGGTYIIKVDINPKLILASYVFDGPARTPGSSSNRAVPRAPSLRQTIESDLVLSFMEEMDDDTRNSIGQAVVYRTLGLPIPERQEPLPIHQQLLERAMETDPDIQQRLIDRAVRQEFGDDNKPQSLKDKLKELRETADLMGLPSGGGKERESWSGVFASVFKGLVDSGQLSTIVQRATGNPIPSQHQQEAPPPGQVVESNHSDVADQSSRPPQPASQPPQASAQEAESEQAQQPPGARILAETEGIQGLSAETDWFKIVTEVDVDELDKGIKGDPAQFVRQLYVRFMDGGEKPAGLLIQLFRDNSPVTLVQDLIEDLLPKMRSDEWASIGPRMVGGADKYQTWVSEVEYLCTPAGLEWLNIAHDTCEWHEKQIKETLEERARIQAGGPEDYEMESLI